MEREIHDQVWVFMPRGEFRPAIESCKDLNARYPAYAPGWHVAGNLALRLGNVSKSIDFIKRAIKLKPENPMWTLQYGHCCAGQGELEQALALARTINRKYLESANLCSSLGDLFCRLEDYEVALRCYLPAAGKAPKNKNNHYNLAAVYLFLGEFELAEQKMHAMQC